MQQDNSQNQHADDTAPATGQGQTASPITPPSKAKHVESLGERKFNFLTYNVIGYMANVLMSIGAVYWVERTHGGQKFMDGLVKAAKKIPGVDGGLAKIVASKSFFLTGGFAVMLPMKMLEDQKAEWVKKENQKIYGDKANTDPEIIQSQKEIEIAPKQTWASLGGSRLLSLVPFYITTALMWDRTSPLAKATKQTVYFDRPIGAVSRWIGQAASLVMGDKNALTQISHMQKHHPGTVKAPNLLIPGGAKLPHDPVHVALPYYFISELITSAAVAWGVFAISRTLGPFFDKKTHEESAAATEQLAKTTATSPAASAVENAAPTMGEKPHARVEKSGIEHVAPSADLAAARA